MVPLLLDHGAFIDQQSPSLGNTALMEAVLQKQPEAVQVLLHRGARTDVLNHWHQSAAQLAREDGLDTIEGLILEHDRTAFRRILTSAGAAASIDLCLHLVDRDFGAAATVDAARMTVVPLTREAGQAQHVKDETLGDSSLTSAPRWIDAHARQPITVVDIATAASVSARTLNRRFLTELGLPTSRWLARACVRITQQLLETTNYAIERGAAECGLGSTSNLRASFTEIVGTSPSRYRRALTVPE